MEWIWHSNQNHNIHKMKFCNLYLIRHSSYNQNWTTNLELLYTWSYRSNLHIEYLLIDLFIIIIEPTVNKNITGSRRWRWRWCRRPIAVTSWRSLFILSGFAGHVVILSSKLWQIGSKLNLQGFSFYCHLYTNKIKIQEQWFL